MPIRGKGAAALMTVLSLTAAAAGPHIEANLSKTRVYVGEPFVLTYTFSLPGNDVLEHRFIAPSPAHIAVKRALPEETLTRNGHPVYRRRYLLEAMRYGTLDIPPAYLKTARRRFAKDAWSRWETKVEWTRYASPAPAVEVLPLPDGAVLAGDLTLRAELDRNTTAAGEPVTLTLTLEGSGGLDDMPPVPLTIPGVTVFARPPEVEATVSGGTLKGKWVRRYTLVADEDFTVPSVIVRVFDLKRRQMRPLQTLPLAVRVETNGTAAAVPVKKEKKMDVFLFWPAVAAALLLGAAAGAAGMYTWLRRRRRIRPPKYDSLRALLIELFRHLDDPEARAAARRVERHLYEGAEEPDEAQIAALLKRLREEG